MEIMNCCLSTLRRKEVISEQNGCRIGFVDDLEIDIRTARVCSIVIYGRPKCFGIFGRWEDCIIPWDKISLIGEDTILVSFKYQNLRKHRKKRGFFKVF